MNQTLRQFIVPVIPHTQNGLFYVMMLLIISVLYLGVLQVFPTMLDPDGFYHAKMALLTAQQGYVTTFPYLPETLLATYWTDQHWLYHLFLVPLVSIMDPLWAVKLGTFILGVLYILIFYYVLNDLLKNFRTSFWWSLALLTASPFVFRLILVKAQPLAFIFLLLGIIFFLKHKQWLLFFVQFLYVLAHGSFLLLPMLISWSLLFSFLFERKKLASHYLTYLKSISALSAGVLLGVVVQPTFPENLIFYWHQMITIGIIGISSIDIIAYEWRSTSLPSLFKSLTLLSFISVITLPFMFFYRRRFPIGISWWAWLLLPLLLLSLRSIRNIEFFVPFLVITLALIWANVPLEPLRIFFAKNTQHKLYIGGVVCLLLLIWVLFPLAMLFVFQKNAIHLDAFQQEAERINEETTINTLALNTRWDSFPMLFYYTDDTKFLTGLDPVFLYLGNRELYKSLVYARNSGDIDGMLTVLDEKYDELYLIEIVIDDIPKTFTTKQGILMPLLLDGGHLYKINAIKQ